MTERTSKNFFALITESEILSGILHPQYEKNAKITKQGKSYPSIESQEINHIYPSIESSNKDN